MHQKALLFSDPVTAGQILSTASPRKVKTLGRKVRNFSEEAWNASRESVVEEGTYLKFTAAVTEDGLKRGGHPDAGPVGAASLRELLLSTGDRELVEASPFDPIWGIGFAEAHAEERRSEWGLNLLGKALMRVRERLRREDEEVAQEPEGDGEEETGAARR